MTKSKKVMLMILVAAGVLVSIFCVPGWVCKINENYEVLNKLMFPGLTFLEEAIKNNKKEISFNGEYHTAEEVEKMFYENQEDLQYVADMILSKEGLKYTGEMQKHGDILVDEVYDEYFTPEQFERLSTAYRKYGIHTLYRKGGWGVVLHFVDSEETSDGGSIGNSLRYAKNIINVPEEGYSKLWDGCIENIKHLTPNWWIRTTYYYN